MKKLKLRQNFVVALFSLYYDKQYIVDGFWMVGGPLIDPKYSTKMVEKRW